MPKGCRRSRFAGWRRGWAPAMSLYRHVRNKEALIALMTDAALGEEKLPDPPPKGWRAMLEAGSRMEWRVMRRHPWLSRVMPISRPSASPNGLAFANYVMRALEESRLDSAGKLEVHVLLHAFTQGMAVNLEAEAQAVGETGLSEDEHMRSQEPKFAALVASGRYPYFAKMLGEITGDFVLDIDALFERGLIALLDGLTAVVEKPRSPRARRGALPG